MQHLSKYRGTLLATGMALAIAGAGLVAQVFVSKSSSAEAQSRVSPSTQVPRFEVDPYWPRPLPNQWRIGNTIGVAADKDDNIWIIQRPGSLEAKESYLTRKEADCCTAAPDVLQFNQAGQLMKSWGRADAAKGHDWPSSNHGITVAPDGTIWLGASGAGQPGPAPGTAAQFAPRTAPRPASNGGEGGGEVGTYHDSFLLHYTTDGKFINEIGKANGSKGSLDTNNVRGVAQIRFLPDGTLVAADGYGNHRVSMWDAKTLKNIRIFGAYGKPPSDAPIPHYNVNSPQFGNPVHCAQPSKDGMLYVCDRTNNRLQVFKFDGSFVKQYPMEVNTKGDGSVWEVALSKDPEEKFMYISDGANEKIHVFDRATVTELYSFGGGGRLAGEFYAVHSITTDSKGNIYTTETYRGQRVQKFVFKGLVPLGQLTTARVVGNSIINP